MQNALRPATSADIPALRALIDVSVRALSRGFYSEPQVESALRYVFGPDTQLMTDRTYFVLPADDGFAAAGGWSKRRTLYGGDQMKLTEDPELDPAIEAARIRAFYVHPAYARRGLGRMLLEHCSAAARDAGFLRLELMSTMPGVPLYTVMGFTPIENVVQVLPDGVEAALRPDGKGPVIRVCVAGISGWVGVPLAKAIRESGDLELVAGVARSAGERDGVPVFPSVEAALTVPFDVLVDYTSAIAVAGNVRRAVEGGRHVVVGSSGMTDAEYEEIDALARARGTGVIAGGNFSLSAALLQRFATEAAKYFPDVEVVDLAHKDKLDAPSGTARELSWRLGQVTGSPPPVHSVRLPGYTIGVEVRFGAPSERLTLEYDGGPGAEPYIAGTLLAVRRVSTLRGVVRGFDTLL